MKKYLLIPVLFLVLWIPSAHASVSASVVDGALVMTGTAPTDQVVFFNRLQASYFGTFVVGTSTVSVRPIDFWPDIPAFPGLWVVSFSSENVPHGCIHDLEDENSMLDYNACLYNGGTRVGDVSRYFSPVDDNNFEVLNFVDPVNSMSTQGGTDGIFSGVSGQWFNMPDQFRLFAPSDTEYLYDVYDTYCEDEPLAGSWEGYTFSCDLSSSSEAGYWYFDDASWYANDNGTGTGYRYYLYDPI